MISDRPEPPRRVSSVLLPLLMILAAFTVGAVIPDPTGVVWGLAASGGTIFALRRAGIAIGGTGSAVVVIAGVASTSLTVWLAGAETFDLTPSSTFVLGLVWLVFGGAVGLIVGRLGRPSAGTNTALMWAGAGALAAPMAVTLDLLSPGEPDLTARAAMAVLIALVGGASTLSAATGIRGLAIGATVLVITVFAGAQVGFSLIGLFQNLGAMGDIPNFWPPDFNWAIGEGTWWWLPSWDFGSPTLASPLLETFRIAILGSLIGCLVALPVSFLASRITAPGRLSYLLDKGFMNVIRTIPDLFWAMFFVAAVSIGPFAGVLALIFFSLAIMAKLLSETIDAVDTGPLEAARATGGSHFPAVRVSVLPEVLPNYVAYALYILEINIRASVVLGLVGAGGIGRVLEAQRSFFQFDRVLAVVILIFVIVFIVDQISVALRRRLV
ncbi:MAG: phosphonate ABC transporter, permease protein PhnE [Actinobacteria bacterium]|nr:phosphonate ABC transporter, permease protein PhnE [Actinomycetota bacterium]